jgi:predicted kinase
VTPRALFLNGAVGVGKTTTLEAVGNLLAERQVNRALVDLDWLRELWPAPSDDPFHLRLELANLTAVVANFWARGAETLVLSGVLEQQVAREAYARAVGCRLVVVRLTAPRQLVRARLAARHVGDDGRLAWHLARFDELTESLDAGNVDDEVVEVGPHSPRAVADLVLRAAGWTPPI